MNRQRLVLAMLVSVVMSVMLLGFTGQAAATKEDHEDEPAFVTAKCSCKWDVRVIVKDDHEKEKAKFDCKWQKVFKKIELPEDFEKIIVKTTLKDPSFLSAECKLDKKIHDDHKRGSNDSDDEFRDFEGSCEVEFCKIDFKVFQFHHEDHDDKD